MKEEQLLHESFGEGHIFHILDAMTEMPPHPGFHHPCNPCLKPSSCIKHNQLITSTLPS